MQRQFMLSSTTGTRPAPRSYTHEPPPHTHPLPTQTPPAPPTHQPPAPSHTPAPTNQSWSWPHEAHKTHKAFRKEEKRNGILATELILKTEAAKEAQEAFIAIRKEKKQSDKKLECLRKKAELRRSIYNESKGSDCEHTDTGDSDSSQS